MLLYCSTETNNATLLLFKLKYLYFIYKEKASIFQFDSMDSVA